MFCYFVEFFMDFIYLGLVVGLRFFEIRNYLFVWFVYLDSLIDVICDEKVCRLV